VKCLMWLLSMVIDSWSSAMVLWSAVWDRDWTHQWRWKKTCAWWVTKCMGVGSGLRWCKGCRNRWEWDWNLTPVQTSTWDHFCVKLLHLQYISGFKWLHKLFRCVYLALTLLRYVFARELHSGIHQYGRRVENWCVLLQPDRLLHHYLFTVD